MGSSRSRQITWFSSVKRVLSTFLIGQHKNTEKCFRERSKFVLRVALKERSWGHSNLRFILWREQKYESNWRKINLLVIGNQCLLHSCVNRLHMTPTNTHYTPELGDHTHTHTHIKYTEVYTWPVETETWNHFNGQARSKKWHRTAKLHKMTKEQFIKQLYVETTIIIIWLST